MRPASPLVLPLQRQRRAPLIASIGEHLYLATDKGALCDRHVLLCPNRALRTLHSSLYHVGAAAPGGAELWAYTEALKRCFEAAGCGLLTFERHFALRGKGGNHAHVNAVPLPLPACALAKAAFAEACAKENCELVELTSTDSAAASAAQLSAALPSPGAEYFLVTLDDRSRLLHVLRPGGRMGMQLGREVLARLLGTPEKADWEACTSDQEGEEARCARLKAACLRLIPLMGDRSWAPSCVGGVIRKLLVKRRVFCLA